MVSKPDKEGPGLFSLLFYAQLSEIFTLYGKGQADRWLVFPEINETPFFPSNADFNQISSVWAKCIYWQDMFNFWLARNSDG